MRRRFKNQGYFTTGQNSAGLSNVIMLFFRTKLIRTSFDTWDTCYVLECASTGIGLIKLVLQAGKSLSDRAKKVCLGIKRNKAVFHKQQDSLNSVLTTLRVSIPASSPQRTDRQTLPGLIISEY